MDGGAGQSHLRRPTPHRPHLSHRRLSVGGMYLTATARSGSRTQARRARTRAPERSVPLLSADTPLRALGRMWASRGVPRRLSLGTRSRRPPGRDLSRCRSCIRGKAAVLPALSSSMQRRSTGRDRALPLACQRKPAVRPPCDGETSSVACSQRGGDPLTGIIGARRAWTASMISALSMPCR
jgi:hypothetical protein